VVREGEDTIRDLIRQEAGDSVTAWAKARGFSQSYVAKVLRGEMAVSKALAAQVGYQRNVYFTACVPAKESA